ncbi:putative radical SAM protein [Magnetofaba australis IT-1]|uniref:Putative radical SAM protein n=2 Tax=Magnetofaba TaxID=1472292 RepID=A0A1Y2K0S8_9PROT|nr:putative radical SAM protein [Magnetofaba australis IT-1]
MNHGGAVVLEAYGRSSGFCVDPIEKKPLHHFLPGTPVLSFGTAGCNLTCKFCQNWEISKARDQDALTTQVAPEAVARAAQQTRSRSVAYTYNDPVIFLEYAMDCAQACREVGVRSVAVTAGYIQEKPREALFAQMDAANVDLKAFSETFYRKVAGGHLQNVLDTLIYLKHHTTVWFEITTLLIPGHNDSESELQAMTQWIVDNLGVDVPLHFSAFHPDFKMRNLPRTPMATLQQARRIARGNGLRYVYLGNVRDHESATTYCPGCGATLIGRVSYELDQWGLDAKGACRRCGTQAAGVFEAQPGSWGARRLPIRIV